MSTDGPRTEPAAGLPEPAARYLRALERALSALPAAERQDLLAELSSHLAERAAQGAADPLAGFDPPEAYAAAFVQERALSSALARGHSWGIGRALLGGARRLGWWYVVLVLGLLHVYGVILIGLAALKPFFPANVGAFVGARHGLSLSLGFLDGPDLASRQELLGWWAIPVFLVLGVVALWGGNAALRGLGRWRLARLRAAGAR